MNDAPYLAVDQNDVGAAQWLQIWSDVRVVAVQWRMPSVQGADNF